MLEGLKCFEAKKRAQSQLQRRFLYQSIIHGIIFEVIACRNQGYCIAFSDLKKWLLKIQ